jgi:hypothetical protein
MDRHAKQDCMEVTNRIISNESIKEKIYLIGEIGEFFVDSVDSLEHSIRGQCLTWQLIQLTNEYVKLSPV